MSVRLVLDFDLPADLDRFHLPQGVQARVQTLLEQQDAGLSLTSEERSEAEGLAELSELLTWLRLRAERAMA